MNGNNSTFKESILVVDDEPVMREILADILLDEQYNVFIAANGTEAINIFDSQSVDLVITDIRMEKNSGGIDLLKYIKENTPDVEVVLITGHESLETTKDALRFGAYDYITKPFDIEKLVHSVKRALSEQRVRREKEMLLRSLAQRDAQLEGTVEELQAKSANLNMMVTDLSYALELSHKISVLELSHTISVKSTEDSMMAKLTEGFCHLFDCCAWGILSVHCARNATDASLLSVPRQEDLKIFLSREAHPNTISFIQQSTVTTYQNLSGEKSSMENVKVTTFGAPLNPNINSHYKTQINLPLIAHGKLNGIAFIHTELFDSYSKDKIHLFGILVNQLAVSLENTSDKMRLFGMLVDKLAAMPEKTLLIEETKRLAITDELTGLYNRRRLNEALELEFLRAERYEQSFSFGLLDIDHFKNINDTYGHLVGDEVLKQLADLMVKASRRTDTIGRYGGEEFAFILTGTDIDGAYAYAEKIRKSIEDYSFLTAQGNVKITASIGITELVKDSPLSVEKLVEQADVALYRAKQSGRNRICKGRRHPRFPVQLPVELQPENTNEILKCQSVDISIGGIMVVAPTNISLLSIVKLKVFLPQEANPVQCQGTVRYCIEQDSPETGKTTTYNVGISIDLIDEQNQKRISNFIRQSFQI